MKAVIKIASTVIILLGVVHTYFAMFCHYMDIDNLWFLGSGIAITLAGLLNFVALNKGGTKFTLTVALLANVLLFGMFCYALPILKNLQVYIGIVVFLVTFIGFLLLLVNRK